jgi:hypothetical protein
LALSLSPRQIRLLRLKAQRLLPSGESQPASPVEVLQAVCGVQAQDLPAARLSIAARSTGLTSAKVEQARQEERYIVWTWGQRGTLHLLAAQDARWLLPFLGPDFIAASRRRMAQLGWETENTAAGLSLLTAALAEHGSLTRPEVRRLCQQNGLPFEGQATVYLLYRAALEGLVCAGADRGKETTYVLFEEWVGELQTLPRQEALEKIASRYLQAYAPARSEDLASWSGLKLGEARQAWDLITDQLAGVEAAGQTAWLLESQLPWLDELDHSEPVVNLLPRFDTYLLGYASRSLAVPMAFARRVHPGGGIIYAVLLVDGEARGTWKTARRRRRLELTIEPFEPLPSRLLPAIEDKVANLGRFLGEQVSLIFD